MMPLSMVKEGEPNIIKKVGGKEETRKVRDRWYGDSHFPDRRQHDRQCQGFQGCHWKRYGEQDYGIDIGNAMMNYTEKEQSMKTLKEVACGQTVKVKKLTGEGPVKRRIMDMGITKGVDIYVRKVAPLGDPVEVTVRGYELSLRKADAEMIEVE